MALLSLIPLCKIINNMTEILSGYTSKNFGILIMTILGNLSDLIIMGPFFSKGHSDIVHGMIIGNLVSILLLLGTGPLIGCYKNTTLKFDKIMVYFCYLYYIFAIHPKVISKERNEIDDYDVSIDIDDETESLVFLVLSIMESLVEDLNLSKNFLSIIVFGFIGGVPEHAISINSFYKDDSDSGLNNAFGLNLIMMGGVLPIFTILGWIMNLPFSMVLHIA
ncbi:hypothetical protein C2G38_2187859 [Gigaspora rosea]|uniref:Sodium/calcium exchanger membrane region domain-containing protein n=1 Tax=Gigaspora rosea TaxID=44941 RepID=A0A397V5N2_9GLOM|nr:hypothetical protein C2G38_2187859 [Gigaspora rosea]